MTTAGDNVIQVVRSRAQLPTPNLVEGIFAEALKFGQASAFEDEKGLFQADR